MNTKKSRTSSLTIKTLSLDLLNENKITKPTKSSRKPSIALKPLQVEKKKQIRTRTRTSTFKLKENLKQNRPLKIKYGSDIVLNGQKPLEEAKVNQQLKKHIKHHEGVRMCQKMFQSLEKDKGINKTQNQKEQQQQSICIQKRLPLPIKKPRILNRGDFKIRRKGNIWSDVELTKIINRSIFNDCYIEKHSFNSKSILIANTINGEYTVFDNNLENFQFQTIKNLKRSLNDYSTQIQENIFLLLFYDEILGKVKKLHDSCFWISIPIKTQNRSYAISLLIKFVEKLYKKHQDQVYNVKELKIIAYNGRQGAFALSFKDFFSNQP